MLWFLAVAVIISPSEAVTYTSKVSYRTQAQCEAQAKSVLPWMLSQHPGATVKTSCRKTNGRKSK